MFLPFCGQNRQADPTLTGNDTKCRHKGEDTADVRKGKRSSGVPFDV